MQQRQNGLGAWPLRVNRTEVDASAGGGLRGVHRETGTILRLCAPWHEGQAITHIVRQLTAILVVPKP